MSMACFLSIVIPAYNEVSRIGRNLDEVLRFLSSQPYSAEVVVIDDCSKDETAQDVSKRIERFCKAGYSLRLLSNSANRGKGYSVRRGLSEAGGEIALFSDADFSTPITEAPKLIEPIQEGRADVTFGSRALNRELIGVRQPLIRDFGGRVFNLLMRTITGLKFKDTQCGFKAFRREPAVAVFKFQSIERFGFDPELLYIARKRGMHLLEVPVVWNDSGKTTVNYFSDSIKMVIDLIHIRLNDVLGRYDLQGFDFSQGSQPAKQANKQS
jgi:glycosyltransferase involved in cell wall biosynthesis